jgi:AraC family transcriptional regulator
MSRRPSCKSKVLLFDFEANGGRPFEGVGLVQPATDGRATGGLPTWRLHRTIDYITGHLDSALSLPELAANVELSPFHFCRMFKKSTNLTPHQYILQLRIDRARHLLNGRRRMAEIAAELGFADQSHFGAVFKRFLGVTPTQFLRSA